MSIIERTGRWPKVPPTNEQRRKAWEDKYRHVPLEMQIGDVLQRDRPAVAANPHQAAEFVRCTTDSD